MLTDRYDPEMFPPSCDPGSTPCIAPRVLGMLKLLARTNCKACGCPPLLESKNTCWN